TSPIDLIDTQLSIVIVDCRPRVRAGVIVANLARELTQPKPFARHLIDGRLRVDEPDTNDPEPRIDRPLVDEHVDPLDTEIEPEVRIAGPAAEPRDEPCQIVEPSLPHFELLFRRRDEQPVAV